MSRSVTGSGRGPFSDEYRTTSLYFDTDQGDVFHQRRSFARSKYRVRRYGTLPYVFLERKLRKPGILVKRRTTVDIEELPRLADDAPDSGWPGEWFHRRVVLRQCRRAADIRAESGRPRKVSLRTRNSN